MIECEFCQNHEQGDTLYESSDWDGGIGFDYIRDIKYCPLCGSLLDGEVKDEPQTIRCPKCGETDYIRDLERDYGVKNPGYKYKCINCNTYIKDKPQTEDMPNERVMTEDEAIYLLRNTAWIAPSLVQIDEAIEMACEALRKTSLNNTKGTSK